MHDEVWVLMSMQGRDDSTSLSRQRNDPSGGGDCSVMSVSIKKDRVIRRCALITYTPSVVFWRTREVNQIPWGPISTFLSCGSGNPITYHDSRSKPDNSRKEAEGLSRLPSATRLVPPKVPGPDAATGQVADGVDKDTESSEPSKRNENVH